MERDRAARLEWCHFPEPQSFLGGGSEPRSAPASALRTSASQSVPFWNGTSHCRDSAISHCRCPLSRRCPPASPTGSSRGDATSAAEDSATCLTDLPPDLLMKCMPSFLQALELGKLHPALLKAVCAKGACNAFLPRVGEGGVVAEPASGRFFMEVALGRSVAAAIARCPEGGTLLLGPGAHTADSALAISRSIHIFGRGRASLQLQGTRGLQITAAVATLDGLSLECAAYRGMSAVVCISGAAASADVRLQGVTVYPRNASNGVEVTGGAAPTISGCRIARLESSGTAGVRFVGAGTAGRLVDCVIEPGGYREDEKIGVLVRDKAAPTISGCLIRWAQIAVQFDSGAGGRVEGTTIQYCRWGVVTYDRYLERGLRCTMELAEESNVFLDFDSRRGDEVQRLLPNSQWLTSSWGPENAGEKEEQMRQRLGDDLTLRWPNGAAWLTGSDRLNGLRLAETIAGLWRNEASLASLNVNLYRERLPPFTTSEGCDWGSRSLFSSNIESDLTALSSHAPLPSF